MLPRRRGLDSRRQVRCLVALQFLIAGLKACGWEVCLLNWDALIELRRWVRRLLAVAHH